MFERFTESARQIFFFGRWEAAAAGSAAIEPSHLLLAITDEIPDLLPAISPKYAGAPAVREALSAPPRKAGDPASFKGDIPLSAGTKRALAAVNTDTQELPSIEPAHVLLGLLTDSAVAGALQPHDITPATVRAWIQARRKPKASRAPAQVRARTLPDAGGLEVIETVQTEGGKVRYHIRLQLAGESREWETEIPLPERELPVRRQIIK